MNAFLTLGGIFVTAFLVGLSGAMMPGPLLAVTIEESARRGGKAGPLIVLGHAILESALVVAVVLGLATFLKDGRVIGTIAFLGGLLMLWMGQGMVRSARRMTMSAATVAVGKRMHPVAAGILVSLSNPYWTIWWATIGIGYLVMGLRFGLRGVAAFFVGHILSDLAWYTLVSVGVARGRRLLSDRVYQRIIFACGVFLLGFGLWFLWTGTLAVRNLLPGA